MLNDARRNKLYHTAIAAAVRKSRARLGRPPVVLDIGSGSGLLAMMAAKAGAGTVYCVEMNVPLAKLARLIISRHGLAEQIAVITKRSTEIKIGVDMPTRADLLISEILDSSIVGEDVMPTYVHALRRLVTKTAIVLPNRATVTAVLV
eukprot:gene8003-10990_t